MRASSARVSVWLPGWVALTLALLLPAGAWAGPRVRASANPRVVGQGDYVNYTLSATVSGNTSIQIAGKPDFHGAFQVVGTTNSPSYIIRNGHAQRSLNRTYRLRALEEGNFQIKAPTFRVGGRKVQPNTVSIRVTAAGKAPKQQPRRAGSGDDDVFVDANLEPTKQPYVGEQLTLAYYLYADAFRMKVNPQPPTEPSLNDFWIEDLSQQSSGNRQTVRVNGHVMERANLRSYALFPLKAGKTTIDPLQVDVLVGGFMRNQQMLHLKTNPIEVDVQPLPPNAPKSFYEGNVGQWHFEVTTDRIKARMGRPITIRVRAKGDGQIGRVQLPDLPDIEGTRLAGHDDKVDSRIDQGVVGGEKVAEYTIVAEREGTLTIPPLEFSYFDPKAERYRTTRSEPIDIDVRGGKLTLTHQKAPEPDDATDEREQTDVLQTLVDKLAEPRDEVAMVASAEPLSSRPLFWLLFALPALGAVGVWLERPVRRRFSRVRPKRRRSDAVKEARSYLKKADGESPRQALDRTRQALSTYAVDVAGVPAGAVSEDALAAHLQERGVPGELAGRCAALLRQLNEARYSPDQAAKAAKADELRDECRACIDALESARRADKWTPSSALVALLAASVAAAALGAVTLTPTRALAETTSQAKTSDQAKTDQPSTDDADTLVEKAVAAQKDDRWDDAADMWKKVARAHPDSPDVLYNLGTALAHVGDYGHARLALERAVLHAPGDSGIEQNRDLVHQLVRLRQIEQARGTIRDAATAEGLFWWHLATNVGPNTLPIALSVLLWLLFAASLTRRLAESAALRDTALTVGAIAAVGAILVAGAWMGRSQILAEVHPAVVTAQEPSLREGPSEHAGLADVETIVTPGVLLPVREERDGWVKLGFSDGSTAWTPHDNVALVRDKADAADN